MLFPEVEVTKLLSSLIKSSFVSLSEQKKKIEIVRSDCDKIINGSGKSEEDSNESRNMDHHAREKNLVLTQQSILDEARAEAIEIIQKANDSALEVRNNSIDEGFQQGLQEGKAKGLNEVSGLKKQLEEEIKLMRSERQLIYEEIEPKVARIITELVENMVGVHSFNHDTILFLIKKGLNEMDLHGDIVLHISDEDYDVVCQNINTLSENLSEKLSFEVLKDNRIVKNQCIIETELGSIDCSLNERMEGLINQLKLIEKSFDGHR